MWGETRPREWLWEQQIAEGVICDWLVEGNFVLSSLGPSLLPQATARLLALPSGSQHPRLWMRRAVFPGQTMKWAPSEEITGPDTTSSWHALKEFFSRTLGVPRRSANCQGLLWRVKTELTAFLRTPNGWKTVVAHTEVVLTESSWYMTMTVTGETGDMVYVLHGRKDQSIDDALFPFFGMLFLEEAPQAAVGS